MRSYPRNSPEAATRIVALIMVADGHVSHSEVATMYRQHIGNGLGLTADQSARLLRELTEDMVSRAFGPWGSAGHIDEGLLRLLLADVDDPALRAQTLALCRQVAHADAHVSGTEESLMALAGTLWAAPPAAAPLR